MSVLGGSICQSRFICQVWCSSIQGLYSQFTGGSIGQSGFVCQVWCSSIQGIYSQFTGGSIAQSRFICQFWCTGIQGISALLPGGSICKSMFICLVYQNWRHLFLIHQGVGGPSAKVALSANFGVLVFKASLLYYLGGPSTKISFYNNITYYTWQI